ncbi:MAG: hypothetical protein K0B84_06570, partial [Firmicutes bacterium]|nr:hypothetical protein [Bacillota bacterium]
RGEINRSVAKELLTEMVKSGARPVELVRNKGLGLISGREKLLPLVDKVIAENPDAVSNILSGKEKAIAFLVGKVMGLTGGRADPAEVNALLREHINK